MDAKTLGGMLSLQFRYTAGTLDTNLAGISPEDALRPPQPGGNCIVWVLAHLVHARMGILSLLNVAPPLDPAAYERFKRSCKALAADERSFSLAAVRADFAATQDPLHAGLADLTDAAVAAPAPFGLAGRKDETVGSLLVGLAFHEAYHAGQVGMLRRLLGKPGAIV